ncbi:MAG: low molecular weight phosphotyrosine protein phosphatase [Lachnospiraceae bacterium]|nr:low molecular weight phosphotyrosine protein phosphatase [Lachnospiraceae bacterium]
MNLKNEPLTPSPRSIRVLFICHGNICRSAMAEYMFKDMVKKRGIAADFYIESAATSSEEIGNPVYPPARRELASHGINCDGHHARRIRPEDYDKFDYLIAMEDYNIRNMKYAFPKGDTYGKICKMLDFTDRPGNIADPWYTGEFGLTYSQLSEGLEGFLRHLGY